MFFITLYFQFFLDVELLNIVDVKDEIQFSFAGKFVSAIHYSIILFLFNDKTYSKNLLQSTAPKQ